MAFGFANLLMLAALTAVVVPPLIHLLNRRRFDVVDWGAMQFLRVGETVRRRVLLDELVLMALRMAVIAVLVLGLAAPFAAHPSLAGLAGAGRDVVLVLDGSYSMGYDDGLHPSPWEEARNWAIEFTKTLGPADSLVVLQANAAPPTVSAWGENHDETREKLAALPTPQGNGNWPRAMELALNLLQQRASRNRAEIVLLHDNQLFGWADPGTLHQWEALGKKFAAETTTVSLRAITVGPKIAGNPVNFFLAPLRTARPLVWPGQKVTFRTALHYDGPAAPTAPHRLRVEVDGKPAEEVPLPPGPLPRGQVPLTFSHRFQTPGSHLVSLIVEPELPRQQQPASYVRRDCLPGDNRRELAIEVVRELPVLLVDGAKELSPGSSSFFLTRALAQGPDPQFAAGLRSSAVPVQYFRPELLAADKNRPQVLVLADVPGLTPAQEAAVASFVEQGGGVLVVLGERTSLRQYNEQFFREGQGWLPARLEEPVGNARSEEQAVSPELRRFSHPALDLFRDDANGSLGQARFPRWWKVAPASSNRVATWAHLTSGDPWLVSLEHGKGRVLLCTTPLDRSWGSNFPSIWEFPVLVHEMIYHLAGARHAGNLAQGQALHYQPAPGSDLTLPTTLTLQAPRGELRRFPVDAWPWSLENPDETGPYRLQVGEQSPVYYVIQPDSRESDLTVCSEDDRSKVAQRIPLQYQSPQQDASIVLGDNARVEVWWIFFVAVMALLCVEVWFTRRLALERQPK